MSNNSLNVKRNCGAAYMVSAIISIILMLAAVVLYHYVPVSEIANSVEYSAKTGIYFLLASPVTAISAFAVYLIGGLTDKALVKNSVVQLVIFIVSALLLLLIACICAALFFYMNSLGFVAPFRGTVYEALGIVLIIAAVLALVGNIYIFATARK